MIAALPVDELKRSPFPFSPLKPSEIPARLQLASMDLAHAGGVTLKQTSRIAVDLERRATLDTEYLEYLEVKALTYAGVFGEIDALHIEWGATDMDAANNLVLWERLGRILRGAGV